MKALVFKGPRSISLEERPEPRLASPDDVIVRGAYTGVCGTDRNIYLGNFRAKPGVILGHEAVGVVHAVGAGVAHLAPGDRVIVNPTLNCGNCEFCLRGDLNFCDNKAGTEIGVDRDGTFADYALLPAAFLHKVPATFSPERAALVEPFACVLNNVKAARLDAADDVVVVGGGPIGLLWALYASRMALRVTLVESDPFRQKFAKRKLDRVVAPNGSDFVAAAVAFNGGKKPRLVVDTTGVMLERSIDLVAKGGRIVLMGFNAGYRAIIQPLYLVNNGIQIIGAGDYNSQIFPTAIEQAGLMDMDWLITHIFLLEEYEKAFGLLTGGDKSADYGAMKIVIRSAA
jgi:fructokinase